MPSPTVTQGSMRAVVPEHLVVESPDLMVRAKVGVEPWVATSLAGMGLLIVARNVVREKWTGMLDVRDLGGTRALYFDGGAYTGGTSTHASDGLGEVLWRAGVIALDQAMIALETANRDGRRIGRALVELGFVTPGTLKTGLVEQAASILECACVEEEGLAVFRHGLRHAQPQRFGVDTGAILERAATSAAEARTLKASIPALDAPLHLELLSPPDLLAEQEHALWQLAASSRRNLSGAELVERSGLGRLCGLRALARLVRAEYLRVDSPEPVDETQEAVTRVGQLCAAINASLEALDEDGLGIGDTVRELVRRPPPELEEALGGISLDGPLTPEAILEQCPFIPGGHAQMVDALNAVLEEALSHATDTLPGTQLDALLRRVHTLQQAA